MLDIVLNLDERPEAQHALRLIPPSAQVDHPELNKALVAYERARADELERRRDAVAAEQTLPEAEHADAMALADAQMAGAKDPGGKARQKALDTIAEARRRHAASRIILGRAVENVVKTFEEHGDGWRETLEAACSAIREQMARTLDEWLELHGKLQGSLANLAIGRPGGQAAPAMYAASIPAPRALDGGVMAVGDVVEHLRQLGAPPKRADNRVENVPVGATPHWVNRDERIKAWAEQDEARARAEAAALQAHGSVIDEHVDAAEAQRGVLAHERRQARIERRDARRAEREALREGESAAIEAA